MKKAEIVKILTEAVEMAKERIAEEVKAGERNAVAFDRGMQRFYDWVVYSVKDLGINLPDGVEMIHYAFHEVGEGKK